MGFDIEVYLIRGYKLPLSVVFDLELLDKKVLDGDDYQLIDEEDCRDEIIKRNVISKILTEILKDNEWNIHILTSSQDTVIVEKSHFFLFNKKEELFCGRVPDYETGEVKTLFEEPDIKKFLKKIDLSDKYSWEYKTHWLLNGSW